MGCLVWTGCVSQCPCSVAVMKQHSELREGGRGQGIQSLESVSQC